jgi:integrase
MSVRKREWTTASGEQKTAWVCDYVDQHGKRRLKTFERKKDADAFASKTHVEVMDGSHVADGASVTVAEAGRLWLSSGERDKLERSTLEQRRNHLKHHILPFIGSMRLSKLNVPTVAAFRDRLHDEGRSTAMIGKVVGSLGSIISEAQERGLINRNPVRDMRGRKKAKKGGRDKLRIKSGRDFPAPSEIKAFLSALVGRWRPLLLTAVFSGLRASELRGLRWQDLDFDARTISVHQRADAFNEIGVPKSESSARTIPVPPIVLNTLREWKLACPKGELDLVFPNKAGRIQSLRNIVIRGLIPAMEKAGVTVDTGEKDENGKPILKAKYSGLHALRHFYASWCINSTKDGGLGLSPKRVQERLGHATLAMTTDTYGHLFPSGDDGEELAAAERALLA